MNPVLNEVIPNKPTTDALSVAQGQQEAALDDLRSFFVDATELVRKIAIFDAENGVSHGASGLSEYAGSQKFMWALHRLYEAAKTVARAEGGA